MIPYILQDLNLLTYKREIEWKKNEKKGKHITYLNENSQFLPYGYKITSNHVDNSENLIETLHKEYFFKKNKIK